MKASPRSKSKGPGDSSSAEPVKESPKAPKSSKARSRDKDVLATKRRCVSTACIACRRRKSKCDGNQPSCAACASVYGTECVYDPTSDHRRKGVYKKDIDSLKTRNSTLQTLMQGILNYPESEVIDLVREIRKCENLDDVAEAILARNAGISDSVEGVPDDLDSSEDESSSPKFAKELSGNMGKLHLENGSMRFLGGTSNLLYTDLDPSDGLSTHSSNIQSYQKQEDAVKSWTSVTDDVELIYHLLNMYFTWHYTYFATLSKHKFFQDFFRGKPIHTRTQRNEHCTSLLVNAMLALGCHFTSWPSARLDPRDPATAGDHFFKEAKRLIVENDEYENPQLATVQALALMSVREAGCGREAKGWVYSGMSFRMACDLGLNIDTDNPGLDEHEIDARRITFWGCFLFDKCWSNYLGRSPQLATENITVPKFDVFPGEDADTWSPWTDVGLDQSHAQPSRTRAIALQISALCEISNDLLLNFYRPKQSTKPLGKQAEIKRLSDFHTKLEGWRKALPKEMEPREGQLPNVLVMHMFFHLLFIHLFRPFLRFSSTNSPLPTHVSPRKICTQAAAMISKLLRLYKRTYGLRQICNVAVYIAHSACTIHLLNLPDKDARRDITHGVRQLEEISESWPCARRTLTILALQVRKWGMALPGDAAVVLSRAEQKSTNSPSPHPHGQSAYSGGTSPIPHQPSSIAENHNLHNPGGADNSSPPEIGGTSINTQRPGPSAEDTNIGNSEPRMNRLSPTQHPATTVLAQVESPMMLLDNVENFFEDSKDWWLKDQSSLFDNWSRREPYPPGYPVPTNIAGPSLGTDIDSFNDNSGMGMYNIDGRNSMSENSDLSGIGGLSTPPNISGMGVNVGQPHGATENNSGGYVDYGTASQFPFSNGNVYQ